jgi:hypothetical protein
VKWTKPHLGSLRKVRRFAWLPTEMYTDTDTIHDAVQVLWLEHYWSHESYQRRCSGDLWEVHAHTPEP